MDFPSTPCKIILGSKSVARRKIMEEMGYEFTIMTADIDEKAIRREKPEDLVMAIAEAKADAIVSRLQILDKQVNDQEPTLLISADTVVVYEGTVREKPSDKDEARQFMKGYSGKKASTVSSVLVTNLQTGFRKGEWDRVEILFDEISDAVLDKLIEEGDVLHVAGGLIIEHPLVLPLIKEVLHQPQLSQRSSPLCHMTISYHVSQYQLPNYVGTTDSVMGLPKSVTKRLIEESL